VANYIYGAIALTGGGVGALDALDGSDLQDLDAALVFTGSTVYQYSLDVNNGNAESSPEIIAPDANAGDKRWVLVETRLFVVTKTSTYTITDTDNYVIGNTASGSFTFTLPAAANKDMIRISKLSDSNTLTIQRAGSDTIEGETSIALADEDQSVCLISNGSNRWVQF
jgi:hypothetical protein